MHNVPLTLRRVYGCNDERSESRDGENESLVSGGGKRVDIVWSLVDDLILCGESEEDLKVMVGRFVEVCRRKGLKINADKRKVMVLGGEEGLGYEIHEDRAKIEQMSEFI